MHGCWPMMENAKDLVSSIGSATADFAKWFGGGTADVAKRVGSGTADVAKRVGGGTVDIAKKVGPKRGLLGLLAIGVAVGGTIYLVRYLRERAESQELDENGQKPIRNKRMAKAAARAKHAAEQMTH